MRQNPYITPLQQLRMLHYVERSVYVSMTCAQQRRPTQVQLMVKWESRPKAVEGLVLP